MSDYYYYDYEYTIISHRKKNSAYNPMHFVDDGVCSRNHEEGE